MGATASHAAENAPPIGEDDVLLNGEWSTRVWREGVPFTLLQDDLFVAEKYHEITQSRRIALGEEPMDDEEDPMETTGTDEPTMKELEQFADAVRVKLFAKAPSGEGSAVAAIIQTALLRPVKMCRVNNRIRQQRAEIVNYYFDRMAAMMAQRARCVKSRTKKSDEDKEPTKAQTVTSPGAGLTLAGSMFSLGSFRLQLRMLQSFRGMAPDLFTDGMWTIVKTVQEYPAFAFHDVQKNTTDDVFFPELLLFCRERLLEANLADEHRGILLLVLLVFGVYTGRSSFLLSFAIHAMRLFSANIAANESLKIDGQSLNARIDEVLAQMERYRLNYGLGTLTEETLWKIIPVKKTTLRDDNTSDNVETLLGDHSIATDGSYIYSWDLRGGLVKLGTGLNFTVGGRVYARAHVEQYLRLLRSQRHFRHGFYGSGSDVTSLIQGIFVKPDAALLSKQIKDLLSIEDGNGEKLSSTNHKLWVEASLDGSMKLFTLFDDDRIGQLVPDGIAKASDISVTFAFYGDFEPLSQPAVEKLNNLVLTQSSNEDEVGHQLSKDVLQDLLALSGHDDVDMSKPKELTLTYTLRPGKALYIECFAPDEAISAYEDTSTSVYSSNLVYCGGWLYLSLLVPSEVVYPSTDSSRHNPRRLIRISPTSLEPSGSIDLDAKNADAPCSPITSVSTIRPLFVHTSDGKRIFEVEMSADRFFVRVFRTSEQDSKAAKFERSFYLNIKRIQCATFISCFLKILKTELHVGDMSFSLPSFATNGKVLCMILPSITGTASMVDSPSRNRYDCLMFDCDNGDYIPVENEAVAHSSIKKNVQGDSVDVKSFDRAVHGPALCFDACNNLVWSMNTMSFAAYRCPGSNSGMDDDVSEDANKGETSKSSEVAYGPNAALRVLTFLCRFSRGAGYRVDDGSSSSSRLLPFNVDKPGEVQTLLVFVEKTMHLFGVSEASHVELKCLRSAVRLLASATDCVAKEKHLDGQTQNRLQAVHDFFVHEQSQSLMAQPMKQVELDIVSEAFALSSSTLKLSSTGIKEEMKRVIELIIRWESGKLSRSELAITMKLIKQVQISLQDASLSAISDDEFFALYDKVVDFAVATELERVSSHSEDVAHSIHDQELLLEAAGLINCITQMFFLRAFDSLTVLRVSVRMFGSLCRAVDQLARHALDIYKSSDSTITPEQISEILKTSVFSSFASVCCNSALAFSRKDDIATVFARDGEDGKATTNMHLRLREIISRGSSALVACLESVGHLSKALNVESTVETVETIVSKTKTETMESAHEYENSMDLTKELRIPGAAKMTIAFDPKSKSEYNYDYVTFYKDQSHGDFYGEQFYSGRNEVHNWPGVGGNPPLVINSDHCFVYFHSDASNTDWGYKFTATGEIFEKKLSIQRHWLSVLVDSISSLIEEAARLLIDGCLLCPVDDTEARHHRLLQSDLVRHGAGGWVEQNTQVTTLLNELCQPPSGSDAERIALALQRESRRRPMVVQILDDEPVIDNSMNRAIRAVAAAIIHHNMWGMDAYAFAQNLRSDLSEQLLRGWKNAQKMRDWFHLGDAASVTVLPPSPTQSRSLGRQPSAFKGLTDEALEILCQNVVVRAQFLLQLTPMSFSYASGAKRRWGLLAKYGSALSTAGSDSETPLGKWYQLLDELQAATDLRSLLSYRRSSCERMRNGPVKSVTEHVLEFVQSGVNVQELRQVIEKRNLRAESRALGFQLFATAWEKCVSPNVKCKMAEALFATIMQCSTTSAQASLRHSLPTETSSLSTFRLHFDVLLAGCDTSVRQSVNNAFSCCLNGLSCELQSQTEYEDVKTDLVVSILKSLCLDYDVDDAYLLQECKLLTHILRLQGSANLRVRQTAQTLLDVILSRFVSKKSTTSVSRDDTPSDSAIFQSQLFELVGLQLEGAAAALREVGADESSESWKTGEHRLGKGYRGLNAPVAQLGNVRWNHSIMLWVFVGSDTVSYGLKIHDEVQRGPSWNDADDEDCVRRDTGLVVAICSATRVRVEWKKSGLTNEYTFDPKNGDMEVIHVDHKIGGVVFSKGTKTLVKDTNVASPWSHFGLYLNDKRQPCYKVSCGSEKECVYESDIELEPNEWTHIAIVQNEESFKMYVNGLVAVQRMLDPFLVIRPKASTAHSRMIESVHPIADATDQFWHISYPGTRKIRITFDPLSEIDQSSGYVRFYKDERYDDYWGDRKYTGRYHDPERNFPGAQSYRQRSRRSLFTAVAAQNALEIPSDHLWVYFRHNGESTSWGFRLLVTPEFDNPDTAKDSRPILNPYPFFFGEPPTRISDDSAADCVIFQPEVLDYPLGEDEIVDAMHESCPVGSVTPPSVANDRLLHVLALIRTCAETDFGRASITTDENVGDLIYISFNHHAPADVRCASIGLVRDLSPLVSRDVIESQLKRVYPFADEGFVPLVLQSLSRLLNVWNHYTEGYSVTDMGMDGAPPYPLDIHISAQDANALASAYISLFRNLGSQSEWSDVVFESVVAALQCPQSLEHDVRDWTSPVGEITAALGILGGRYDGISIGGRVKCCVSVDNKETIEMGYLLDYCYQKDFRFVRVLFDCDRSRPVNVPVCDASFLDTESDEELTSFMKHAEAYGEQICAAYKKLLSLQSAQATEMTMYKPKTTRKQCVEVFESQHPYAVGENVTHPLSFRKASEIVIFFDKKSCTSGPNDYICFLKRNGDNRFISHPESFNEKPYWGQERYYGDSFPGMGNNPPLRIPAESVDVQFHTELSTGLSKNEWGFKLFAHGIEDVLTYPPEIPPSQLVNAIRDIQTRCLKALSKTVQMASHSDSVASFGSLIPRLLDLATATNTARPTQSAPKSQEMESKHPYANSVQEYMSVSFSGADRLVITFDPRSSTEPVNDFITFFKDKTLTDRWGANAYSGGNETANWPGFGGRPPLVIPSDSFILLWQTDASNHDWGWKFNVVAEYEPVYPVSLRLDQLDKRAHDIWELWYEGIQQQNHPLRRQYEGFESQLEGETSTANHEDVMRATLTELGQASRAAPQRILKTVRVVDKNGVKIYSQPDASSLIVGQLKLNSQVTFSEEKGCWVKLSTTKGPQGQAGWICRRTADRQHVKDIDHGVDSEETIVIGVDDLQLASEATAYKLNDENIELEMLMKFVSQYSYETLKGQVSRLQSLAYDAHQALATRLAQKTLHYYFSCAPSLAPLHWQHVDNEDAFFLFLLETFGKATEISDSRRKSLLDVVEERLRELFMMTMNDDHGKRLISRCTQLLAHGSEAFPKTRGIVRVYESSHPYPDDTDDKWEVRIPGATKLRIMFDPRSKTEDYCDWLTFSKTGSDGQEQYGEGLYCGRGGTENWPGCGGRPPLVIDSNACDVHFHSDASRNDWGYKFFVVGLVDEEQESDLALLDGERLAMKVKVLQMCWWVLTVAASNHGSSEGAAGASVYSSSTVDTAILSLLEHPQCVKKFALALLVEMARESGFFHLLPSHLIEQLRNRLITALRHQYQTEEQIETKSEYLRKLTECALLVELAIDSGCFGGDLGDIQGSVLWQKVAFTPFDALHRWTSPLNSARLTHRLEFALQKSSEIFEIRISCSISQSSANQVLLCWKRSNGLITIPSFPTWRSESKLENGDVFTIDIDVERKVLILRKNRQCILAISSEGNGAPTWSEVFSGSVDSMVVEIDVNDPNSDVMFRDLTGSPRLSVPLIAVPNWYSKLCDSIGLLLDFQEGKTSSVIIQDSSHPIRSVDESGEPEKIHLEGAVALEIRLDKRTHLKSHHQLCFSSPNTNRNFDMSGFRGLKVFADHPSWFVADSLQRTGFLKVEDEVTRSFDWCYGDEDGTAGSVGVVQEFVPWNERNGCGVRVRWKITGEEGVYRYGYNGFFDVQSLRMAKQSDAPLIIPGDSISFSIKSTKKKDVIPSLLLGVGKTFSGSLRLESKSSILSLDVRKAKILLGDELTATIWLLLDDERTTHPENAEGYFLCLVHVSTYDPSVGFSVCTNQDGKLFVLIKYEAVEVVLENETDEVKPASYLVVGQWAHLSLVCCGLRVSIYVDGDLAFEGTMSKRMLRSLYLSTIEVFGESPDLLSSGTNGAAVAHVCDFRMWDASLHKEQLRTHIDGIAEPSLGGPSSPAPQTPQKSQLAFLFPPSPPRSPSRGISSQSGVKQWVTVNRTGKNLVTIRADCVIAKTPTSEAAETVYFEAHALSSGKMCIGWMSSDSGVSSVDTLVGEVDGTFGIELRSRTAHLGGEAIDLEVNCEPSRRNSVASPRRSTASSGAFSGDVFCREGDVLGCAYTPILQEFSFFLNGELVAKVSLSEKAPSTFEITTDPPPSSDQKTFDTLVDKMRSIGFSRCVSEEAVEASGTSTVPRAVEWLLQTRSGDDTLMSPRRSASLSSIHSPRRRSSSTVGAHRRSLVLNQVGFVPAASLGSNGAQGVAWNFGHRAFKYFPSEIVGQVVSVLQATSCTEDGVHFEVYNHADIKWERVSYRHRIQDMSPNLLGWWKLDEGSGTMVHDSSTRGQVGTIRCNDCTLGGDSGATSPRKNKSRLWEQDCVPPPILTRQRGTVFTSNELTVEPTEETEEKDVWGYRFYIIPHYSAETIGRRRFYTDPIRLYEGGSSCRFDDRYDHHLVKYVNKAVQNKQMSTSQVLRGSWSELSPSENELRQWPALVEMMEQDRGASGMDYLGKRFKLLQELNSAVSRLLPLVTCSPSRYSSEDNNGSSIQTLDSLITGQRARIFNTVKRHVWDDALKRTSEVGMAFELALNRPKAMRNRVSGKPDAEGRQALFSQAFRQLNSLDGSHFRRSDPIYYVRFLGENAEDAGGPYRETFAQFAEELQSTQLSLLLPCANAQHNVGAGREKWVLNPGATDFTLTQMYEFIGKLLGVSIRSQQYLSVNIAGLIWKKLVGERVGVDDLSLIDSMMVSSMDKIRTIDQHGVTEEIFEDVVMETFTTLSADNRVIRLKPDGQRIPVTFASRFEYADRVEMYRLHEFDTQIEAVRRGLDKVVPTSLLPLFTGAELELMVCGSPEVDVDLLQRCTEYSGCKATDEHVLWFWRVLRDFSHEERSAFLRFVWGRSRLPATESEFPQLFKLQSFNKQQPGRSLDGYLPIAHTCFFAVEVPVYSSQDVLREKLLYAVFNCQEIDADGDSLAANQLGWEE